MPPYLELPTTANNAPLTRSNSNSSVFSDWNIFEAMVRSEENPTPIDFEIDLDEFFQLNRQRSPVVHRSLAPSGMSRNSSISGTPKMLNSPHINSQNPSPVAYSLSRTPSLSRLSEALYSPAPSSNYYPTTPIHGQATSSLSGHTSVSKLSQMSHSLGINSPAPIAHDNTLPPSLSRISSLSGNYRVFNSPRISSPLPPIHNGQTLRRIPSGLSRSSTVPDNLELVGVNGNIISSPAMTVVHGQSPRPGPSPLSRTSSISGTLSFSNLTPLDYGAPVSCNGQSSLPAQSHLQDLTSNPPQTTPRAPTYQQPAHPASYALSRSSSLPPNSQVFKSPHIGGQATPTRQRPSALSRSHTFSGNTQVSNDILINSLAPAPAPNFLNGQIPDPQLSQSAVSVESNPLQSSNNNKLNPPLKRTRTLSSSSDAYGENLDPDLTRHVRKKKTTKNLSTSASGVYPDTLPLPPGTYEEVLPTPFDPKWFPDAEVEDIMETYKIKFESTRYDGNSSSMGTPMQDCMSGVGLKNPDDLVFMDWLNGGNLEVHLVVTWPGYPYLVYTLPICPVGGRYERGVTREYLAHVIGWCYFKLFMASYKFEEGGLKPQDPRWRMWNGGYTFERLRLLSVERVVGDYWKASMTVLTDHGFNSNPGLFMRDLCID